MKRRRLDSEDDEDEYMSFAVQGEREQLEPFAATTGFHNVMHEMGLELSSSSTSIRSLEESNTNENERYPSQQPKPLREDSFTSTSPTEKGRSERVRCSQVEDDLDIPSEWIGLLSDTLLAVYYVPLTYIQGNRPMDDKLFAQYIPFNTSLAEVPPTSVVGGANVEEVDPNPTSISFANSHYQNPYGIAPGWRWDGVIRGRKKT
ncbi:unnamed protein product [Phytomonas sp. Hart1]|nr:unnamed protein product [Phytomonas sp. Hart1]|eukprot:CCW70850.1 unnamed protein product [Phytomonas sp. isolate Hart1]